MMKSIFKYSLLIIIALATIILVNKILENKLLLSDFRIKTGVNANKLLKEFNDSYPAEIKKTGNITEYDLVASVTKLELITGTEMDVWVYNKQIPGPTLRVKLGDTLRVNFTNNLPQGTTIHWHGIRVPNAMDGVPGVTQDLIAPGDSFVYEFTPKDAGTFWFHPHHRSSEQVERGLYGVLIVEKQDPEKYSQDLVLVLDDWRLDRSGQIDNNFNTMQDLMHDGRWGNTLTTNSLINPSYSVARGERLRLRLINVSNARIYRPSLSGLDAKVIAIDGMEVKESFSLAGLDLAPGNRIDLDLYIPKDIAQSKIELVDIFTRNTFKLANFEVSNTVVNSVDFPLPKNSNIPDWETASDLAPNLVLNLDAKRVGMEIKWTINDKVFPDIEKITLKANSFNKILIKSKSSRLHPMHLHGLFFKVLSRNGRPVAEDYWRDTVLLKSKESIEIGLVPLDKGSWASHCHALEHAEAGMMTLIEVI